MNEGAWTVETNDLSALSPEAMETVFSLANGVMSAAGTPALAGPATGRMLVGGVFGLGPPELHVTPPPDAPGRERLMNYTLSAPAACPDAWGLRLKWNGVEPPSPADAGRTLDLRRGCLECRARAETPSGRLRVTCRRLLSLAEPRLATERIEVAAPTEGALELIVLLDDRRRNLRKYDLWARRERRVLPEGILLWTGQTQGAGHEVCVCLGIRAHGPEPAEVSPVPDASGLRAVFRLRAGQTATVERFQAVAASTTGQDPRTAAGDVCARAMSAGFERCLRDSAEAWQDFWDAHDIRIDGPAPDQRGVRYNLFQLRGGLPPTDAGSVGAKLLTGEWYRFCVFWDTDVFVLPYWTRTDPSAARRHLLWRHRTLPAARALAGRHGQAGARFAWESLPDGQEGLPPWHPITTNEVHVVGDVAWGLTDYVRWTGDEAFAARQGAEILTETARFWMSRFVETPRGLELHHVCGPDEFHQDVNNNVYTSVLARENLLAAARLGQADPGEKDAWRAAAERVFVPGPGPDGRIEQYEGFFDLAAREPGHPGWPGKYLKQADVLMLPMLFPDAYSPEVVRANYEYYEPKNAHRSSLSRGPHAIVAARAEMAEEALRQFRLAAAVDLADTTGKTALGHHAAAVAMVPRMVMEGFAGLRLSGGQPVARPGLPSEWKSADFAFVFRGRRLRCRVEQRDTGRDLPCGET